MKSFKKLVSEVAQPKAGDEIHFKAKHAVEKVPHSHAGDETFKGNTKKATKRRADYDVGEDEKVYEAMDPVNKKAAMGKFKDRSDKDIDNDGDVDSSDEYLHARRKAISKAMKKEEAEDLDEVSKDLLGRYATKAHNRGDMAARMSNHGKNKDMANIANKRYSGVQKAISKLSGRARVNATEETEQLDEIGDTAAGKKKLKNLIVNRTQKAVDAGASLERRPEKAAEYDRAQKRHMKTIGRAATRLAKEEVEQLDELSPNTLHSYVKKAAGNLAGNAAVGAAQASSSMKKSSPDVKRNIRNRMRGITSASGRLADKANMAENAWEEVPMMMRQLSFICMAAEEIMEYLDMAVDPEEWFQNKLAHVHDQMQTLHAYAQGDQRMMSRMDYRMYGEETELDEAAPKIKADFVKTQREKDRAHDAAMGRTPTGRKKVMTSTQRSLASMRKEEAEELDEASPTKKAITRALQGMKVQPKDKVSLKKAPWEKNEEVELDEVTQSAVKKPVTTTGSDGKTRTVYKSIKSVKKDDHGQDKIKESLEESVKPGRLRLDDGSSITVSKQDADLLNQMFKDLNAKNRKKMTDTMMTDKAGFQEIVGFAREAL